jgi:RNAse (barnase) inhibitor barstar
LVNEIEDISKGLEIHLINFEEYRNITSNGFKEIIEINDKLSERV